jgi:hypothetical protein
MRENPQDVIDIQRRFKSRNFGFAGDFWRHSVSA